MSDAMDPRHADTAGTVVVRPEELQSLIVMLQTRAMDLHRGQE